MLSVGYDAIYSRFLSKVQAYDLIEECSDDTARELMDEWLLSIKSNPKVRKLFSSISVDADDRILSFELKVADSDEDSDIDFVTELFGLGIAWKWIAPKYMSVLNTSQFFGGKEQQFFSQANHMAQLEAMNKNAKIDFLRCIQEHGYINNSYLQEES